MQGEYNRLPEGVSVTRKNGDIGQVDSFDAMKTTPFNAMPKSVAQTVSYPGDLEAHPGLPKAKPMGPQGAKEY